MHKISIETAKELAHLLVKIDGIKGVDIFGSVAREGYGADFDLIILTNQEKAQEWWVNAKMRIRQRSFFTILYHKLKKTIPFFETVFEGKKRKRGISIASDVLNMTLFRFLKTINQKIKVDIIVLSENWRDGEAVNYGMLKKLNQHPIWGQLYFLRESRKMLKD